MFKARLILFTMQSSDGLLPKQVPHHAQTSASHDISPARQDDLTSPSPALPDEGVRRRQHCWGKHLSCAGKEGKCRYFS